ncbi:MAG: DNA adenine methylase [Holosporaceae bacterium]|jgi:DNA adenine methylase|nr:DNA adenine methylase [Holosporaceae bacterium]
MKQKLDSPKPFVKWAGGKRGIIKELISRLPKTFTDYYEPFVGGGALFFAICNERREYYISDININLMIAYQIIKVNLKELIEKLKLHEKNHSKEYYYRIRERLHDEDPVSRSANFIYLLKTCYNGLHRVNRKGEFNTPFGDYKNPVIVDSDNLEAVHNSLQKAAITYSDYLNITPSEGDFVYFDPPYSKLNPSSFVKYDSSGFSETNQEDLRNFAESLDKKGVKFMISNADTERINYLYKSKRFVTEKIKSPRTINCKGDERASVVELIIRNYQ